MNKFNENPLFLFVDDFVDDSQNFASDGKIVELFDTGCDARTPGATFNRDKDRGSNIVPGVRKPSSLSQRQDKVPSNKSISPDGDDDRKQGITGTEKASHLRQPVILNQSKDNLIAKGNETEVKPRLKVGPEKHKARPNSNRTWLSSKYAENTQSKQCKRTDVKSPIRKTFGERGKTTLNKPAPIPRTISKDISQASLNYGINKVVNRAVDKDSLSNCSRQLEMAKTSGVSIGSKYGYVSKLPRSAGVLKTLAKSKADSAPSEQICIDMETKRPESNTILSRSIGDTKQDVGRKSLQSITTRTTTIANIRKNRDRPEGEINVDKNSKLVSEGKPESRTSRAFDDRNTTTSVSSRSKIFASKVPLPRFSRHSITGEKIDQQAAIRKSKSNDKLSSEKQKTQVPPIRESKNKGPAIGRPATYPDKVPARPSTKSHNLIAPESGAKTSTISIQDTMPPKARTLSMVPKSINQIQIRDVKHNEICTRSPRSLMVPSIDPQSKIKKPRTESIEKPSVSSGVSNDQVKGRSGRVTASMKKVSSSKIPVDHQGKSKADEKSVSLTGVRAVKEKDEEVELQNILADISTTVNRETKLKSPCGPSETSKNSKESKVLHPPVSSTTGSKVPRPVSVKRFIKNPPPKTWPKKEETTTSRKVVKTSVKTDVEKEVKASTPSTRKSAIDVPESKELPEAKIVAKAENDEDVIPIMNPAFYNVNSIVTRYPKRANLENTVPQETAHGGKIKSWIDGHEQAYLRGRAIGLKVASMARAAKQNLKREFIRSGLKSTTPISPSNKSQEIVDIGLSVIEKVLAERDNKIHSPSFRADHQLNYHESTNNSKWDSTELFMYQVQIVRGIRSFLTYQLGNHASDDDWTRSWIWSRFSV